MRDNFHFSQKLKQLGPVVNRVFVYEPLLYFLLVFGFPFVRQCHELGAQESVNNGTKKDKGCNQVERLLEDAVTQNGQDPECLFVREDGIAPIDRFRPRCETAQLLILHEVVISSNRVTYIHALITPLKKITESGDSQCLMNPLPPCRRLLI